jgi:poly-gamma-glutamate capsule biosynthesis protein CapA/YwtB (metallophosphatase superfamily)
MIDWKNNGQGVDIMKRILPFILILIIAGSLANCVFLPGNESSGSSDIGHEDVETTDNGQTETPPPQQNDPEPSPGIHTVNTQKPEETPAATIEPDPGPEQEETVEIRISFAGDCTIGTDEAFTYVNSFPDRYERVGGDDSYFFRGVKPIFENDDLTLVNLETTFTREKKKAEKKFRFKGDPSYVNILKEGSIEAVNISNNHIYDYLKKGFQDTLATLEQAGILYSGEGHIAYYETKGITIGSIGYQGWSTGIKDSLKNDILEARQKADIVIVSFHWGIERSNYPNSVQIELGRFSIDHGADIVVGHHPHVIQGIDKYKDKYIVYSLGNFCFGGNRNPSDKDTFVFQSIFTFRNGELAGQEGIVYPCSISSVDNVNDYQPTLLKGKDRERVINRLLEYSTKLKYGITKDDVIFAEEMTDMDKAEDSTGR